jgi:hypothetical protein
MKNRLLKLASSDLETENRQMEVKLAKIRSEQMKLKSMVPDALPGTTRWSSAALPTESRSPQRFISNSAPEVANSSGSSRVAGGGLSAVAALRRKGTQGPENLSSSIQTSSSSSSSSTAPVTEWTVSQVSDWLSLLGLERYSADFSRNEISGSVLIDISGSDLDYLNVTALGHRKMILKGIEQLRTASGLPPSTTLSSPDRVSSEARSAPVAPVVHWSNVAVTKASSSSDTITNQTSSSSSLLSGDLNEEAERKAFQDAVQAWRNSSKTSNKASEESNQPSLVSSMNSGSWSNPADGPMESLLDGNVDEEAERRAFQAAVEDWRRGSSKQETTKHISKEATVDGGTSTEGVGRSNAMSRASCYNCFALFFVGGGFIPRPVSIDGCPPEIASLSSKSFCSSACYETASLASMRREASAKAFVQADAGLAATGRALLHKDDDSPLNEEFVSGEISSYGSENLSHSPINTSSTMALADFAASAADQAVKEAVEYRNRLAAAARESKEADEPVEVSTERKKQPIVDIFKTHFDDYV